MYQYNYRSFEKFGKTIVALAIFTDENPDYHPKSYKYKRWDTELEYKFKTYKVLDYTLESFEKSDNPFAVVMQTARSSLKNKAIKNDEDLLSLKMKLFRNMLSKGYDKKIILKITNFIKNYVKFREPSFKTKFDNQVDSFNKKRLGMGIFEVIKQETIRIAKEEGIDEGIEKGIEKGQLILREDNIKRLHAKGFSMEDIADLLGLDIKYVLEVHEKFLLEPNIKE